MWSLKKNKKERERERESWREREREREFTSKINKEVNLCHVPHLNIFLYY